MSDTTVLYGFDGSTFARTVRMVLATKGIAYDNVQVNVLKGEPRQQEHLQRHPFRKAPVLVIDGLRLRETDAICRYLKGDAPWLAGDSPSLAGLLLAPLLCFVSLTTEKEELMSRQNVADLWLRMQSLDHFEETAPPLS